MTIGRFAQVRSDGTVTGVCITDIADSYVSEGYHDKQNDIRFIGAPEGVPDITLIESYRFMGGWYSVGARPSIFHDWSIELNKWVPDVPRAANLRNLYINKSRLDANLSLFTFVGQQIAVDTLSRGDIDAVHGIVVLTNEMPDGWVGGWKAVNNSYVSIPDVATWTLFYKAMVNQGTANFAHSQDLKAKLAAATTIQEVEAITW